MKSLSPESLSLSSSRFLGCGVGRVGGLRRREAFTLVEVTLAIGIVSFAFVAMFGLLPVGLSVSRQAIDTTIEAQIVQKLKTQALQTDFSQLETLHQADPYYFDDQGKKAEEAGAMYKAFFAEVPVETQLPANVSTRKLRTVTIYVVNTKGNSAIASENAETSRHAKKFTLMIPDNGL